MIVLMIYYVYNRWKMAYSVPGIRFGANVDNKIKVIIYDKL